MTFKKKVVELADVGSATNGVTMFSLQKKVQTALLDLAMQCNDLLLRGGRLPLLPPWWDLPLMYSDV